MWSNRNLNCHSLWMRIQNGTHTSEEVCQFFQKTKHSLTIQSSNHVTTHLSNLSEDSCLYETGNN